METKFEDGSNIFFTSDTHFYHEKIITLCNRPFSSVDEMNKSLIAKWNSVVPPGGLVFHLGDFCFCGFPKFKEIFEQLNGKIVLIKGNHDDKNITTTGYSMFEYVTYQMQIMIEGKSIYLNHFPFLCYGGSWRGENSVWQLFGHVHSGSITGKDIDRLVNLFSTQYDVGVDNNNYAPISFKQVKEIIDGKIKV